MAHGWQLLERPAESAAIRQALTGDGRGVVIVGSAGVGKTTLARMVTTALRTPVRWVAGTESARGIPLGAFAHLVGPSTSRDPIGLLAAARKSLAEQGDVVLGVDDAHQLDQLSATLLHQLAIERVVRVVATVRSGEPVPDAVLSLWKDGYLQRFELEPFTKDECVRLVESVIGGQLEGLSADVMWEASGGNALYLRHLVEGAMDAGRLTKVDDVWQLRGGTVVTPGLAALLDHRLGEVGENVLNALRLLAFCEPLDIDVLCELAGDAAVDGAELRGLIRIEEDESGLRARFSHPLFGDVIRRRVGTASARRLRGRIVTALRERNLTAASDRIKIAQLYLDSDQTAKTRLLISAAKDAISLSNVPLGERLARAALDREPGLDAAEILSRALLWQGQPQQADFTLGQFTPDDLDEMQLVRWGILRMSILFWSMSDVDRAHEVLSLLGDRVTHPLLRCVVEATGSAMAVHENDIEAGVAAAETILARADAPSQAVEWAAFAAGLAMPVAGRGFAFEPIAARCRAETKATDGMIRVMVRYCDVLSLVYTGQLELAQERADGYAEFSSAGQFLAWAIAKIMAGVVAAQRGRFPDAVNLFEQALAALNAEAPLPWRLPPRLWLAKAYAALGRTKDAERVLTDAAEHTGRFVALYEPQVLLAQAWLAAAEDAESRSIRLANAAAAAAATAGQHAVEAEALHSAARFGDHNVAVRLAELVALVDGPIVSIQARHAAAVAGSDAAALDEVRIQFEEHGLLLYAADAAAQAAVLHGHRGHRHAAVESSAAAMRLAAACGGAATPAIRVTTNPLPLTSREREIGMLVAAGLTNKQIAERLTLSVRTVEGHLYRACIKLDVSDREGLAKLMRQQPE